jgi:hypothetical protein
MGNDTIRTYRKKARGVKVEHGAGSRRHAFGASGPEMLKWLLLARGVMW